MTNNFSLRVKKIIHIFLPLLSHKLAPELWYASCNNRTLYLIAILATRLPRSQQFSYQEDTGLLPTGWPISINGSNVGRNTRWRWCVAARVARPPVVGGSRLDPLRSWQQRKKKERRRREKKEKERSPPGSWAADGRN